LIKRLTPKANFTPFQISNVDFNRRGIGVELERQVVWTLTFDRDGNLVKIVQRQHEDRNPVVMWGQDIHRHVWTDHGQWTFGPQTFESDVFLVKAEGSTAILRLGRSEARLNKTGEAGGSSANKAAAEVSSSANTVVQ
jgi:hypothetical protein